ncbi:putative pentatricopeptide [Medicago truncatula]|uniref:Putative pentatricopeptide n=1 Tax=Medicago truncatula TaxID=3880 RepID=A0A396JM30_MEDTR|nr:putative pentatricopeptide [Medicago truncatula]
MLIEDPTPPTHEFNHLLSSIAKTFPKTNGVVVDSYTEMLKMGISLDLVSYNILMKCYADAKLMGYSLSLFGKVFKLGFQSTGFTLNTLLKPLFSSGKVVEAIQFYNSSDFYGIPSYHISIGILVKGLCDQGNVQTALMCVTGSFCPHISMLNPIFDALCKNPDTFHQACKLFADFFHIVDLHGDIFTYNVLIRGYCVTNQFPKAFSLYKKVLLKEIQPNLYKQ